MDTGPEGGGSVTLPPAWRRTSHSTVDPWVCAWGWRVLGFQVEKPGCRLEFELMHFITEGALNPLHLQLPTRSFCVNQADTKVSVLHTFSKKIYSFISKLGLKQERERHTERLSTCWFTWSYCRTSSAGPGQSQELFPGIPSGWQGPRHLGEFCYLFQAVSRELDQK